MEAQYTQHDDIQHNYTQRDNKKWDTYHKIVLSVAIKAITVIVDMLCREVLLKGKARYNWPPCTN
jgi:hypothetical protein